MVDGGEDGVLGLHFDECASVPRILGVCLCLPLNLKVESSFADLAQRALTEVDSNGGKANGVSNRFLFMGRSRALPHLSFTPAWPRKSGRTAVTTHAQGAEDTGQKNLRTQGDEVAPAIPSVTTARYRAACGPLLGPPQ